MTAQAPLRDRLCITKFIQTRTLRDVWVLAAPSDPGGASILDRVLRGTSDAAIDFHDLRRLLLALGFQERLRGGHHIYTRNDVAEILNLQPKGKHAKPYQVKQVRHVILTYKLGGIVDEKD